MAYNRYCGILEQTNRGYLVAFDLQWQVVQTRRVNPEIGAAKDLALYVTEFENQGWTAESKAPFGFVFMRRDGKRILVQATPKDPYDTRLQSFNPYKQSVRDRDVSD